MVMGTRDQYILGVDPSSTATGYALLWCGDARVLEAGLLKVQARWPVLKRVDAMVADLAGVLDEWDVGRAVIEVPSGKVHRGRHGGGGAGLSLYGLAAGAMRQLLIARLGAEAVSSVTAEQWTGGKRKQARNLLLAAEIGSYAAVRSSDRGGDVGDAIALGRWWWRRHGADAVGGAA